MSEVYTFRPKGVCSQQYVFEIEDDVIRSCQIIGGCPGNLLGISKLIVGMTLDQVIDGFEGTHCGLRRTSCPDQIARALKSYRETHPVQR